VIVDDRVGSDSHLGEFPPVAGGSHQQRPVDPVRRAFVDVSAEDDVRVDAGSDVAVECAAV